jgi:hypothetical protein
MLGEENAVDVLAFLCRLGVGVQLKLRLEDLVTNFGGLAVDRWMVAPARRSYMLASSSRIRLRITSYASPAAIFASCIRCPEAARSCVPL